MHTSSARPRPQHLTWIGTTLRADDAWWSTHYPPNGWRCKCSVRPVSEAGLRRQGKRGPDEAPPVDLRPWRSRDGKIVTEVPHGIDPGFGYNPGQAWQQGLPPPATPRSPLSPTRQGRIPPAEAVEGPAITPSITAPAEAGPVGTLHEDVQRALRSTSDQAILCGHPGPDDRGDGRRRRRAGGRGRDVVLRHAAAGDGGQPRVVPVDVGRRRRRRGRRGVCETKEFSNLLIAFLKSADALH